MVRFTRQPVAGDHAGQHRRLAIATGGCGLGILPGENPVLADIGNLGPVIGRVRRIEACRDFGLGRIHPGDCRVLDILRQQHELGGEAALRLGRVGRCVQLKLRQRRCGEGEAQAKGREYFHAAYQRCDCGKVKTAGRKLRHL